MENRLMDAYRSEQIEVGDKTKGEYDHQGDGNRRGDDYTMFIRVPL